MSLRQLSSLEIPLRPHADIRVFDSEFSLLGAEALWNELLKDAEHFSAFHQWAWLLNWWAQFGRVCPLTGDAGRLHVVAVFEQGEVIGLFPMFYREVPPWRLRKVKPVGYSGEVEPRGLTEEPLLLIRRGYSVPALKRLMDHLEQQMSLGRWDCYVLTLMQADSGVAARLAKPPQSWMSIRDKTGPWGVDLPPTWDAFRKNLSKSMRDNIAYYPKLLTRKGHVWEIKIVSQGQELQSGVAELARLHRMRARSKGRLHHNYFPLPDQERLLATGHCSSQGFVASLYIDGEVAAAQSFIRAHDELVVGYSGFDPKWAAFSPLLVIEIEVCRQAISNGVKRLNLLLGDAPWQRRWKPSSPHSLTRILGFRRHPWSALKIAGYIVRREVCIHIRRLGFTRQWDRIRARISGMASAAMMPLQQPHTERLLTKTAHLLATHHHLLALHR